MNDADQSIVELSNAVLQLRRDLRIERRDFGGEMCYVIEDCFRAKFYRVGPAEHLFITLLDGSRTIQAAVAESAATLRERAFSENEALAICRWLLETQLVENAAAVDHARLSKKADERPSFWAALRNPLWIRLPLFNPTAALDASEPWLAWTLSRTCAIAWCVCCVYAIGVAIGNWDALVADTLVLLDRNHWWLLAASWLLLKLLHETYHALVCRKYGGRVSEAGIFLLLFAPVPYVELNSSWRFPSRWQRIATAAAGIYIELFVAAVAVIVWTNSGSNTTKYIATSIAVMASAGTLLVNANPLMRFDGYFMLSDLVGIPNLNARGRQWLRSRFEQMLGVPAATGGLPAPKSRFVIAYAIAALGWRVFVCVALVGAILVLLARVHMVLALACALAVVAVGASRTCRYLFALATKPRVSARRLVGLGAVTVILLAVTAFMLVGPSTIRCPGIVEYHPLATVRTASPGFIRELRVDDGDAVEAGQVLAVLENGELALELRIAELAINQSVAKCRMLRQAGETAKEQAELATQAALREQSAELARQIESLTVRAPASGRVIGRNLATRLGRYVETGDELLLIGDEASKEVVIALAHDDVDLALQHGDEPIRVRFSAVGVSSIQTTLASIEPRATMQPPHEALSSENEGPLPVQLVDDASASEAAGTYQLLDPCFKASAQLTAEQSARLRAGQLATIEFASSEQSWARRAQVILDRWFDRQIRTAR